MIFETNYSDAKIRFVLFVTVGEHKSDIYARVRIGNPFKVGARSNHITI